MPSKRPEEGVMQRCCTHGEVPKSHGYVARHAHIGRTLGHKNHSGHPAMCLPPFQGAGHTKPSSQVLTFKSCRWQRQELANPLSYYDQDPWFTPEHPSPSKSRANDLSLQYQHPQIKLPTPRSGSAPNAAASISISSSLSAVYSSAVTLTGKPDILSVVSQLRSIPSGCFFSNSTSRRVARHSYRSRGGSGCSQWTGWIAVYPGAISGRNWTP